MDRWMLQVVGRALAAGRCLAANSMNAGAWLDAPACDSSQALQHFTWDNKTGTTYAKNKIAGRIIPFYY